MSLSPGLWTSEVRSHIPFDSVPSIVHAPRRCWNISFLGTVIVYAWQKKFVEHSSEPHHSCVASKWKLHSSLPGLSPSYSAWFPHLRENGHPISLAPPSFCPFTGASQIHLAMFYHHPNHLRPSPCISARSLATVSFYMNVSYLKPNIILSPLIFWVSVSYKLPFKLDLYCCHEKEAQRGDVRSPSIGS